MKTLAIIIITPLLIWIILSAILLQLSSGMIFIVERSRNIYPLEQNYVNDFYNLEDGTLIDSLYHDNESSEFVVLYFHGNSGRIPNFLSEFDDNFDYYAPAIAGFHASTNKPNTERAFESGLIAYDRLKSEFGYADDQIIVFGHSLGGPIAVHVAGDRPETKVLVLVNSISSVRRMCMRQYSIFCVFGGGIMNGVSEAENIKPTTPIFQYHLIDDGVVAYEEGRYLYDSIDSDNKSWTDLNKGAHSRFDMDKVLSPVSN